MRRRRERLLATGVATARCGARVRRSAYLRLVRSRSSRSSCTGSSQMPLPWAV